MTPAYEYFETDADIGVIGRGATAAEAFVQTALGVFALIVEPGEVEERERREVRAHGDNLESLLVAWINECLYVHDVEGFVARRIELEVFDEIAKAGGERLRLHSFLHGEEVDPARHRLGTVVKAATMHQVSTRGTESGFETRLVLDV
jgi:SHS2 domain-containing protein